VIVASKLVHFSLNYLGQKTELVPRLASWGNTKNNLQHNQVDR